MLSTKRSSLFEQTKPKVHRTRTPSIMQRKAVANLVEKGGSKGQAIREAGYSEAVANNPQRVFNSPAVMELMKAAGIDEIEVLKKLNKHMNARKSRTVILNHKLNDTPSDDEIYEMFAKLGFDVWRIERTDSQSTRCLLVVDDTYTQLEASEKVINILGIYAPKKVESKNSHLVGIFSMSDLRKKMKESGIELRPPENEGL